MSYGMSGLAGLFDKELAALRNEVEGYPDDASVWRVPPGIANAGGTLVLHLTGNLQHFVGASLGGSGYVRDKAAEFSDRGVPRTGLLARIDQTREIVARTLEGVDDHVLGRPFPGKTPDVLGEAPTTGMVLTYMYGHFTYHRGQVNYHRRFLTGRPADG